MKTIIFTLCTLLFSIVNCYSQWKTKDNSVILIDSTKNVGIGISTPSEKLELDGNLKLTYGSLKITAPYAWAGNWRPALITPLGSSWRSLNASALAQNYYLGYGITSQGWYWITSSTDDNNGIRYYPMSLALVNKNTANLTIQGKVTCTEVKVQAKWWDDVFKDNYKLRSLEEVKKFIELNKHLPDVTSGETIEKDGLDLGEVSSQIIRKIEELTLYVINQNNQIQELQQKVSELEKANAEKKK